MNSCQLGVALEQIPVHYHETTGHAEFACGIASHYMNPSFTCGLGAPTQKMGIAIANSNMHFSSSKWTHQCTNNFVYVTRFLMLFTAFFSHD